MTYIKREDRCGVCGSEMSCEIGHIPGLAGFKTCASCRVARADHSRRWYQEHASEQTQRAVARQRVKERVTELERSQIFEQLLVEQGGTCLGCHDIQATTLALDWSWEQSDETSIPLVRGVTCRRCKIAYGRWFRPSRFVLGTEKAKAMETLHGRPLQTVGNILLRCGSAALEARRQEENVRAAKMKAGFNPEESIYDWLDRVKAEQREDSPSPG